MKLRWFRWWWHADSKWWYEFGMAGAEAFGDFGWLGGGEVVGTEALARVHAWVGCGGLVGSW